MTTAATRLLARLPPRQLHLLMAGLLLVAISLLCLVLRAPVQALQAARAERARLESTGTDSARLVRDNLQLSALIAAGRHDLDKLDEKLPADQLLVDLIGEVDRAATRHGVALGGAVPGPARKALIFYEMPFDVDARGSYQALVDWMAEIERSLPTLSIVRFEIRPDPVALQRIMKIRIAAYRSIEATP